MRSGETLQVSNHDATARQNECVSLRPAFSPRAISDWLTPEAEEGTVRVKFSRQFNRLCRSNENEILGSFCEPLAPRRFIRSMHLFTALTERAKKLPTLKFKTSCRTK